MKRKFGNLRMQDIWIAVLMIALVILLSQAIIGMIRVNWDMSEITELENGSAKTYDRYYALITREGNDSVWQEICEGGRTAGTESGSYIEWYGQNLNMSYTREELMRMAIDAKVDGIILEAGDNSTVRELIDEAESAGIPVVTVLSDCYGSGRQSSVGVGSYNLGREYGRQIISLADKDTRTALVLLDSNAEDTTQNVICNGIRETLANEGNHLRITFEYAAVDSGSTFSSDESIRKLLVGLESLPDIIICLNEKNTLSTYQAVIDYNIVGRMAILGYDTSDTVLRAIEKQVISSTVAIDFQAIGEACVQALDEYIDAGYVSDYFTIEVNTVNSKNLKEYRKR